MGSASAHWSDSIRQVVLYVHYNPSTSPALPISLAGGSNRRQFVYISSVEDPSSVEGGCLFQGDIVLQVNDVKVAGFTLRDAEVLLVQQASQMSPCIHLAILAYGSGLPLDLGDLLHTRFPKDTPDHALQCDIRANIHRYIIPFTTKVPSRSQGSGRPLEDAYSRYPVNDDEDSPPYQHVTEKEFLDLEQQNFFLESGFFEGHYYGTPCPENISLDDYLNDLPEIEARPKIFPGSSIEEIPEGDEIHGLMQQNVGSYYVEESDLPEGWERIEDQRSGIVYYVDHIHKTTQSDHPNESFMKSRESDSPDYFWQELETTLVKSRQGFGFSVQQIGPSFQGLEFSNGQLDDVGKVYERELRKLGNALQITEVAKGGPADEAFLKPGDVLCQVNETPAANADHRLIAGIFQALSEGDSVDVVVKRFKYPSSINSKSTAPELPYLSSASGSGSSKNNSSADNSNNITAVENRSYRPVGEMRRFNTDDDFISRSNVDTRVSSRRRSDIQALSDNVSYNAHRLSAGIEVTSPDSFERSKEKTPRRQLNSKQQRVLLSGNGSAPAVDNDYASLVNEHSTSRLLLTQNSQTPRRLSHETGSSVKAKSDSLPHSNEESMLNVSTNLGNTLRGTSSKGNQQSQHHNLNVQFQSINDHLMTISIMKGSLGFGFTLSAVALQGYQVQVNQVLDLERCDQLKQGDIITGVNGASTLNLSKDQVVNMLKTCPENQVALVSIIRGVVPRERRTSLPNGAVNNVNNNVSRLKLDSEEDFVVRLTSRLDEFGFEIRGGSEENSNIFIGAILNNTAAAEHGALRSGDEVLEIDGVSVLGESHSKAVWLLKMAKKRKEVTLRLRRPSVHVFDLTLRRTPDESFGFVIVTSNNKQYTKIGGIMPGSPADRCQKLTVDDRLYAVNGIRIQGLEHPKIVSLIKDSGLTVTLTLSKEPLTPSSEQNSSKASESRLLNALTNEFINTSFLCISKNSATERNNTEQTNVPLSNSFSMKNSFSFDPQTPPALPLKSPLKPLLPPRPSNLPSDFETKPLKSILKEDSNGDSVSHLNSPVGQILKCRLVRDERVGFGFSVRGGVDFGAPINIYKIAPGGPADRSQLVKIGDVILEVNGATTQNMRHVDFLNTVRNTPSQVQLVLSRAAFSPTYSSRPSTPTGNF